MYINLQNATSNGNIDMYHC